MSPSIHAWISSARPRTLILSVIPFIMGTLLASFSTAELNLTIAIWAVLSALCIQIATNLINEAYDVKKGADTENRIGPKRGVQQGILSVQQVYLGGCAFLTLALLFGLPLIQVGGMPILSLLAISAVCAYVYTGGPYPLAYNGLGEVFVIAFFGVASTAAAYFLQSGYLGVAPCVLGLQLGLLACVPIAVNNCRDQEGDARVNKRTLVVRFGALFGKIEVAALILLPYILNLYWTTVLSFIVPLLALPLGIIICKGVKDHPPGSIYNKFLALSVLHYVVFCCALALSFYL